MNNRFEVYHNGNCLGVVYAQSFIASPDDPAAVIFKDADGRTVALFLNVEVTA